VTSEAATNADVTEWGKAWQGTDDALGPRAGIAPGFRLVRKDIVPTAPRGQVSYPLPFAKELSVSLPLNIDVSSPPSHSIFSRPLPIPTGSSSPDTAYGR